MEISGIGGGASADSRSLQKPAHRENESILLLGATKECFGFLRINLIADKTTDAEIHVYSATLFPRGDKAFEKKGSVSATATRSVVNSAVDIVSSTSGGGGDGCKRGSKTDCEVNGHLPLADFRPDCSSGQPNIDIHPTCPHFFCACLCVFSIYIFRRLD